ncbi:MAG: hypothetical protein ACHRXM_37495, partial [Isosphaerales bacterium]
HGGGGGHHGGAAHRGAAVHHTAPAHRGAAATHFSAPRLGGAIARSGGAPHLGANSNARVARQGVVKSRNNLNSSQGFSGNLTRNQIANANRTVNGGVGLNNGGNGYGSFGYGGINAVVRNSFGLGIGNRGYGYGLGGYGGYGYGYRGYGYGNGRYVWVYAPGIGWVTVPLRDIRRF